MIKKIIIYSFIIYLNFSITAISNEIKILYKINNSVITSQDVIEEINYLVSHFRLPIVPIYSEYGEY